jgi:chromate transporter
VEDPPLNTPRSPWQLAWVCNRLALQGFGGVLAVAQHEFVERERWLTQADFVELLAAAQVLPGPNVINVAIMLGERHFGWRGVVAALAGMLTLPLLLLLLLASVAQAQLHQPVVQDALRGMGLAAAGLLLGTAWKLAQPLKHSPLGLERALGLAGVALILAGVLRLPLAIVVLLVGGVGMALAVWPRR